MTNYENIQGIVTDRACRTVDGFICDLFTAGAIVKVADNLNETNTAKFIEIVDTNLPRAANIALKLIK